MNEEEDLEIDIIVMKLVGDIEPIGLTHYDDKTLYNLKKLTSVVDSLLYEISYVARKMGYQASIAESRGVAKGFLKRIVEEYGELTDDIECK